MAPLSTKTQIRGRDGRLPDDEPIEVKGPKSKG